VAGYRGYTPQLPESINWVNPGITAGCNSADLFAKNIRQAVWGSNDSNPYSATCIPAASYLQGDVLVVRSAANKPTIAASAVANTFYLRSNYVSAEVFLGSTLPADATATNNYAIQEYVYYISPFTNSTATTGLPKESPAVPALYRVALNSDAINVGMKPELVATGIEHLEVQFGMSNSDGTTQYFNADSVSATANDDISTGATNWDKISSVRIWLLARNSKPEMGFTDTASYTMGDVVYPAQNDNFRRQVFTSVVQLRNFRN
jgi:type IV pilus assembly protein PilW